jgi:hypothetical protein
MASTEDKSKDANKYKGRKISSWSPGGADMLMAAPDAELGPALANGKLPDRTAVKDYYTRPGQLAKFLGWTFDELVDFLFFKQSFKEHWKTYTETVLYPRLNGAKDKPSAFRHEVTWRDIQMVLQRSKTMIPGLNVKPQADWNPRAWTWSTLYHLRKICRQSGMFRKHVGLTKPTQIKWVYMLLKCREYLQCNPELKEEVLDSYWREKGWQRAYDEEDAMIRSMRSAGS